MHCSNRFSLYPFSRSWFWQVLSQTKQYQIVYFTWGPQLETIICESLLFPGYGVVGWYSTCTLSWRCWLWAGTGEGKCQNMLLHSSRMVPRGNLIRMLFRLSSVCAAAATMLCRWWLCFVTPIAQYMCIALAPRMRMSAAKRQDLQRWLQNSWPSRMATSALCKAHTVVASCPSKRSATSMARAIGACLGWGGWFLVNSIMEYFVPIFENDVASSILLPLLNLASSCWSIFISFLFFCYAVLWFVRLCSTWSKWSDRHVNMNPKLCVSIKNSTHIGCDMSIGWIPDEISSDEIWFLELVPVIFGAWPPGAVVTRCHHRYPKHSSR